MKKIIRSMNSRLFDVAAGPVLLMLVGVPLLVIAAVIILIVFGIRLAKKAKSRNEQQTRQKQDPSENG